MALPAYIDAATGAITDGDAWVAVASETLGADAATVTFTSTDDGQVGDWSQYLDLVLICYGQTASTGAAWSYYDTYFNNDTTVANYKRQTLESDGSTMTGQLSTAFRIPTANVNLGANVFGAAVVHLSDINSGKYKLSRFQGAQDGDGSGFIKTGAVIWYNQSPITEIDLVGWQGSYDIKSGSRFDLFGVLPRMVA